MRDRRDSGPRARRLWASSWPPVIAIAIVLLAWQGIVWTGWKPDYVLPGPVPVVRDLAGMLGTAKFWSTVSTTMSRAVIGYALAVATGTLVGLAVVRFAPLRAALGSLITGLQTMPSIAWFPLAILLFGLSEQAITFVIVLGAAPSIANGVISGVDDVPPQLVRVAHVLGARGTDLYGRIMFPAALPTYLAGIKQGWAFAWRSLMAGELLVIIANRPSLGVQLQYDREFSDTPGLIATMIVILVIGVVVDQGFTWAMSGVRRRRGLGAVRL